MKKKQKILILEDDILFNETIADFLDDEGYDCDCAYNPKTALDLSYANRYDLYLLDVNLPFENGFEFLKSLRESGDTTPAIFLTSRDDKKSLLDGFNSGCDDYMQKPIDLDELLLRIKAVLHRLTRTDIIKIGDYEISTISKNLINSSGKELEISNKAIDLLILLISANNTVVSFLEIKNNLWSSEDEASDGSLRVYITQIKKYFPNAIINKRGIGYLFDTEKL